MHPLALLLRLLLARMFEARSARMQAELDRHVAARLLQAMAEV